MITYLIEFECEGCGEVRRVRRIFPCARLAPMVTIIASGSGLTSDGWDFRKNKDLCTDCAARKAAKDARKKQEAGQS